MGDITVIVPVVTRHVGCINVTVGAASVEDCVVIITLADADEVHPAALVTVKLYVPAFKPDIVVLVPVPVIPPGFTVHVPVSGKPFNTTLPVSTTLVGCVIVDTVGAAGATQAHELVTTLLSKEIAPAVERPLPKREELPNKWIGPSTIKVPLKTEPVAKSNSPPICQYTLHNEAELVRVTVEDAPVAKAPPILIINKAFG